MKDLAPIIFIGFARADHTAQTLAALAKNDLAKDSVLYAFCDGPRHEGEREKCEEVRDIIRNLQGFADVVPRFSDVNLGLKLAFVEAIGPVLEKHGRAIMVEDDIVTTPYYLPYLNEGLERYRSEPKVFSICGFAPPMKNIPADYPYDVFFSYRNMSWGWATWADRWAKIDLEVKNYAEFMANPAERRRYSRGGADTLRLLQLQMSGKANTWDSQWNFTLFTHEAYAVLPVHSLIQNIGADGTGVHYKSATDRYRVDISLAKEIRRWPTEVKVDPRMAAAFRRTHDRTFKHAVKKAVRMVRGAMNKS